LNGNTFSFIGRELTLALFSDLAPVRKRELASAVTHYIAGVLDDGRVVWKPDGSTMEFTGLPESLKRA
jgi:hypothetical protein